MSVRSVPKRVPLIRLMTVLVGVVFVVGLLPAWAMATLPVSGLQQSWGTNGRVSEILADPGSGRVYVAGNFTEVADSSGATYPVANVAVFLPASGTFDTSWKPNPDGAVNGLALLGGKLYLGGAFTQVGTDVRRRLAAVDASTGALTNWRSSASAVVTDLAANGNVVYVGGNFATLGGDSRAYLGRVDASTGSLDTSWTPAVDARVRTLALTGDGSKIYVGGDFATVNGSGVGKRIASLTTANGAALTPGFNAAGTNQGAESPAFDLYIDGGNLLAAVAGSGGACASLTASTGKLQWSDHANGNMQAVTAVSGTVYCGGHFGGAGSFAGTDRYKLAAVNETDGAVQSFAPRVNRPLGVWALDHDTTRLYVGGDFTRVSGKSQPYFAMFS